MQHYEYKETNKQKIGLDIVMDYIKVVSKQIYIDVCVQDKIANAKWCEKWCQYTVMCRISLYRFLETTLRYPVVNT